MKNFKTNKILTALKFAVVIPVAMVQFMFTPMSAWGADTAGKAEVKEVCHDKTGKDGKPVKKADGTVVQECKKIKVHKKLEGTEIPPAKK